MKALTGTALNKIAIRYYESLSHILYEQNGEEKEIDFSDKTISENIVQVHVLFNESYKGDITHIRVIDKDGDVAAEDNRIYRSTSRKALYISFKHEFTEI